MSQEQETLSNDGRLESGLSMGDEAMADDLQRRRRLAIIEFVRRCLAGGLAIVALLMLADSISMPVDLPDQVERFYIFLVAMGIALPCVSGVVMLALRYAERYYTDEREAVRIADIRVSRMAYLLFLASIVLPWWIVMALGTSNMDAFRFLGFPVLTVVTFCFALPVLVLRRAVMPYANWHRLSEVVFLGIARGWTILVPLVIAWISMLSATERLARANWVIIMEDALIVVISLYWFAWALSALLQTEGIGDPAPAVTHDLYAKRGRPRISHLLGVVMTLGILVMAGFGLAGLRKMLDLSFGFASILALVPALMCVWNLVRYRRLSQGEDMPCVLAGQVCLWRTYEVCHRLVYAETIGLMVISPLLAMGSGLDIICMWPFVLAPLDLIVLMDDERTQDLSDVFLVLRAFWQSLARWVGMLLLFGILYAPLFAQLSYIV